jgi:DNA-binding CsgD family transcriptional regulator
VVLERAYPALLRLVDADCAALGVSRSGRAAEFEWLATGLPPAYFAAYPQMAPHDFVREAVTKRPNVVLRDQEMITRSGLEANMMYHRARELGAPLEHVMAVMLHGNAPDVSSEIDGAWQSGLAVYRDRRRPFGLRERAALKQVTPALAHAVWNCRQFDAAIGWQAAMTALLEDRGAAALLVAPPAVEVARTKAAAAIIERWFPPHERRPGRLPAPLGAVLARALSRPPGPESAATWTKGGTGATLRASVVTLPPPTGGRGRWMLLLEELPRPVHVPAAWQQALTPAELAVCTAVLHGWDNRLVAATLRRSEETVKKQLQSIFDKLGIASRAALIARAAELRCL